MKNKSQQESKEQIH